MDRLHSLTRSRRLAWATAVALVVGAALVGRAVLTPDPVPTRTAVLGRELAGLDRFLAGHAGGFPDPGHDRMVVRLREHVLRGALEGVLPFEASFGNAVRLELDRASVVLERGLALVRVSGRGTLERRPHVSADVGLLLSLDVRSSGRGLVAGAEVLGFDLDRIRVRESTLELQETLDALAEEIFLAVGRRVSGTEVPVRLPDVLVIPPVEASEITIPGARIPLSVRVRDVVPLDGQLWVALGVHLGDTATDSTPSGRRTTSGDSTASPDSPASPDPCGAGVRAGIDWCGAPQEADTAALVALVAARLDSALALVRETFEVGAADSADVAVRISMDLLRELLTTSVSRYLGEASLHVREGIDVRESGDVKASLGPLSIPIGTWRLHLTIERLDATLRGDTLAIEVLESDRLGVRLPVHVSDARGLARLRFQWDAAAVAGLLCSDFSLDEVFEGTVPASTQELRGYFAFSVGDSGLVADPVQTDPLRVRPVAEAAAWRRVREVLDERDGPLDCGLGMDADELEANLRSRMERGFEFELPESILRPLVLPAFVGTDTEVGGSAYRLEARPRSLVISERAVEYGFGLALCGRPTC